MKFLEVPVAEAEGHILAHATTSAPVDLAGMQMSRMIPKGTVLSADHVADMIRDDVSHVPVAILEKGDVAEDAAALTFGRALVSGREGVEVTAAAGGRVNIKAVAAGLLDLKVEAIHSANRVSSSITVATLPLWAKVGAGGLLATIKIIPFAVPSEDLKAACERAKGALGLRGPVYGSATLIETQVGRDAPSAKGRHAMQGRVAHFGMMLSERVVVPHTTEAVAEALREAQGEVLLILTDTATSDIRDTAPAAVREAGGEVVHYGMPVDPGNLLFLGRLGDKPVIGLPGCARSPALNGADWVLERVICGAPVGPDEIMSMGVGGLLKDIPQRGRPRDPA